MKTLILALFMVLTVTLSPVTTAVTHMGAESPDLHVTLVSNTSKMPNFCEQGDAFRGKSFFRVTSSGEMSASAFVIPKGWNLIVTDVAWMANPNTRAQQAGNTFNLRIMLSQGSPLTGVYPVFNSFITQGTNLGRSTHTEHLTTGFVVGSGVDICPNVISFLENDGSLGGYIEEIILNGYLSQVPKPSRHN